MDKKIYIANWKSHKTSEEVIGFMDEINESLGGVNLEGKELVIAPPFILIPKCHYLIKKYNLPIKLAAQNVSAFPKGAYTGEVNASQIKEFANFVIIGHSERRKYLHESESDIENKVREALSSGLEIVQCVQDENGIVYDGVGFVAYEPPSSIGSGNPDEPEHVSFVFKKILEDYPKTKVLYGGSINPDNVNNYLKIENLSGFLIGGASLEPDSLINLLK